MTQYVTILRLMESPRDRIVIKLLNAHKIRSQKLIDEFELNHSKANENQNDELKNITFVRRFHQNSIVGLIEAAKGVHEV